MKFGLSIATFIVTFVLSVVTSWPFIPQGSPSLLDAVTPVPTVRSETSRRMENFLRRDVRQGSERNMTIHLSRCNNYSSKKAEIAKVADATSEYVRLSSSMDDSQFPRSFQIVWRKHMEAWKVRADFLQEQKSLTQKENVETETLLDKFEAQGDVINSTWYDVLAVAREYDVDTSGM
jgi:hypothetical protein